MCSAKSCLLSIKLSPFRTNTYWDHIDSQVVRQVFDGLFHLDFELLHVAKDRHYGELFEFESGLINVSNSAVDRSESDLLIAGYWES